MENCNYLNNDVQDVSIKQLQGPVLINFEFQTEVLNVKIILLGILHMV